MAKSYDIGISLMVNVNLDDPEDNQEIARKIKPKVQELINESIGDYIDSVELYDDRMFPCDNCDIGEMIYDYSSPTQRETITHYRCNECGHTQSFP